jgi:RES domain-containing protein
VTVWRLARSIYQDLSGAGGLLYKGRWNQAGLPVVYTSGSRALSVLERRVHSRQQPKDDAMIEIEVPSDSVEQPPLLPDGWENNLEVTRQIGSDWLRSNRSLCLAVPSVLVPDLNYLINPLHANMNLVRVVSVTPFKYYSRLFNSVQE